MVLMDKVNKTNVRIENNTKVQKNDNLMIIIAGCFYFLGLHYIDIVSFLIGNIIK